MQAASLRANKIVARAAQVALPNMFLWFTMLQRTSANLPNHQNVQFRASTSDFMNRSGGFSGNDLLTLKYGTTDGGHTFTASAVDFGLNSENLWGVMDTKRAYSGRLRQNYRAVAKI